MTFSRKARKSYKSQNGNHIGKKSQQSAFLKVKHHSFLSEGNMKFLKIYFYKFTQCCQRRFPGCANLCRSDETSPTNEVIRSILLYFYGLLLGGLFWKFVLSKLGLSFDFEFSVGLVICLILGKYCDMFMPFPSLY